MVGFTSGLWEIVYDVHKIYSMGKKWTWEYLFEVLSKDTKQKKTHGDDRFESCKSSYTCYWRKK